MDTRQVQLVERFRFSDLPKDCNVVTVSIDWSGEPIVLCQEGKPAQPPAATIQSREIDALLAWLNSPPRAHHIIHWQDGSLSDMRIENPGYVTTSHVQPFQDGWIVGEGRGGDARILDRSGRLLRKLDLGDASEHLQTTPDGHIWVGYFDEGVFGNGIGQAGAICFDSEGHQLLRYNNLAREKGLPDIADCYALNVADDAVWLCYYTDFSLVCLKQMQVDRVWPQFGATRAVAIRGVSFVRFPAYGSPYLRARSCDSKQETELKLIGPDGRNLSQVTPGKRGGGQGYVAFQVCARGSRMYVYDDYGLYELPDVF